MNNKITYLLCVIAICGCVAGCGVDKAAKKIPDLSETYSSIDKRPFGAYVAYHQLVEMFYRNTVREEKKNFEESWKNIDDTASVYISIASSLYTTDEDVNSIIAYAEKGNSAFFAAGEFNQNLLNELGCKVAPVSLLQQFSDKPYKNTAIKIKTGHQFDSSRYQYFYFPLTAKILKYNSNDTRILGVNENGDPDFIVVFKGKGRIFLHCEPRAFSNYFLLQKNNYQYLEKAFGYVDAYPEHVYWNNYYAKLLSQDQAINNRSGRDSSFNSFSTILSYPQLAAAFWLGLIMLLLYILFGIKRRQRIIEIVKPNENTTVTFTETIGRLYLQKKDNKNIADKMITYFNEYIRNNYFLNTNLINDAFITTLSRKSGVPRDKVDSLYRAIDHVHHYPDIDDFKLLSLNGQIQDFFKRIA